MLSNKRIGYHLYEEQAGLSVLTHFIFAIDTQTLLCPKPLQRQNGSAPFRLIPIPNPKPNLTLTLTLTLTLGEWGLGEMA